MRARVVQADGSGAHGFTYPVVEHGAHAAVSRSRWKGSFWHILEGLHSMGSSRTLVWAVLLSGFYFAAQVIPI